MRKIASLLAAGALAASGLVAATSPAQAGDDYPGEKVDTTCQATGLNSPRVGKAVKTRLRVTADGGEGAPRGKTFWQFERRKSGVVVEEKRVRYDGPGFTKYAFKGIPRGRYNVSVFFKSRPASSIYKNCRTSFNQRVRPRR